MQLIKTSDVGLRILTISGKSVYRKRFRNEQAGEFKHTIKIDDALLPGVYILEVETQSGIQTMKLIVSE
jgi:hypothetical protein